MSKLWKRGTPAAACCLVLALLPTSFHSSWILAVAFVTNTWHFFPVNFIRPLIREAPESYEPPKKEAGKFIEPGQCPAAQARLASASSSGDYYWPMGRGRPGSYSTSPFTGVWNITAPTWSWHHPVHRWYTVPVGVGLDDKRDIYLTAADGLRKFSPKGKLLWTYNRPVTEVINNVAALMDGAMYVATSIGRVVAVDMQNGVELWSTRVSWGSSGNYGWLGAHRGVVVVGSDLKAGYRTGNPGCCGPPDNAVFGLNATTGCLLWRYVPEVPVWNYHFAFPGDDTFIFQDLEGRAYRSRLSDGQLIWKAGGGVNTWTDGSATMGSNGIVYHVDTKFMGSCLQSSQQPWPGQVCGSLYARKLEDGALIWSADVPKPPNNIPSIGRLYGRNDLSVVMPIGQQCQRGQRIDVYAFNAETGERQWVFEGFSQVGDYVAGDAEGVPYRENNRIPSMTMPNPWGAATIDAAGTVYLGGETGHIFALRDTNGDGTVAGVDEVVSFDTGAAAVGSSGFALAPGMLVGMDISTLYMWEVPGGNDTE
mmetsp:Transcript_92116/g.214099  ORF Transcript_92116/g.214099 Transcript_92116/m.214099 type:complete len:536 (-) Transcript_92116:73-1680(-)